MDIRFKDFIAECEELANNQLEWINLFKHVIDEVSPYTLSWTDEYYYLIAYHERYETVIQFRVDRMADIEVSEMNIPEEHVI
jgi:hypothetical protein